VFTKQKTLVTKTTNSADCSLLRGFDFHTYPYALISVYLDYCYLVDVKENRKFRITIDKGTGDVFGKKFIQRNPNEIITVCKDTSLVKLRLTDKLMKLMKMKHQRIAVML